MNLRTTFKIDPSPVRITHSDRVMLAGSCFATSIGMHMASGKIPVLINPCGTVYNPVSVNNTLDIILSGKTFRQEDLYFHDGNWLSLYHYTDFSSDDPVRLLERINRELSVASEFLRNAAFLFITFGTARIFRLKENSQIVSNCHKLPAALFSRELLTVSDIADMWSIQLDRLKSMCPGLKVIFTISPVRHLKDGAHGNQVSKSVLFLAIEELLKHPSGPSYFPAYELMMDDLRDYRFYDDDMIHPSSAAINYIWEAFTGCYFENATTEIWNEAAKITKAVKHRFNTENRSGKRTFAEKMLKQISETSDKALSINFLDEISYFRNLLNE
jgi:hypothetical protein